MKYYIYTPEIKLNEYFNVTVKGVIVYNTIASLKKQLQKDEKSLLLFHNRDYEKSFSLLGLLQKEFPLLLILCLDDVPNYTQGSQFLKLGIKGYGNTFMDPENITQAIDVISAGNVWLYPEFMNELISNIALSQPKVENPHIKELSPAQLEVAKLVAEGKSNKEVAKAKEITERTVKAHLSAIYAKLEISDRLSLALLFKS